jgi:hypothetical protein
MMDRNVLVLALLLLVFTIMQSNATEVEHSVFLKHKELKFNANSCRPQTFLKFWDQVAFASLPYCLSKDYVDAWNKIRK